MVLEMYLSDIPTEGVEKSEPQSMFSEMYLFHSILTTLPIDNQVMSRQSLLSPAKRSLIVGHYRNYNIRCIKQWLPVSYVTLRYYLMWSGYIRRKH